MACGMVLLAVGWLAMGYCAPGGIAYVLGATAMIAAGWAAFNPGLNSVWANALKDEWRAKTQSVKDLLSALLAAPTGYIGAVLYRSDPRFPYLFVVLLYLLGLGVYGWALLLERRKNKALSGTGEACR